MAEMDCFYIIDDDPLVRRSLTAVLEDAGYEAHAFGSGPIFLAAANALSPSCVIVDVQMPEMNGLEVLQRLQDKWPGAPVIMISGFADIPMAVRAMRLGALDFLEKPLQADDILETIKRARQTHQSRADGHGLPDGQNPLDKLTQRETEVLRLVVLGDQNKVIARKLEISPRTVEVYRARVMRRLGASNLAELVRLAVRWQLD